MDSLGLPVLHARVAPIVFGLLLAVSSHAGAQIFDPNFSNEANQWFDHEISLGAGCAFSRQELAYDWHSYTCWNAASTDPRQNFNYQNWQKIRPSIREVLVQIMYAESGTDALSPETLRTCPAFNYPSASVVFQQFQTYVNWNQGEIMIYGSLPTWFRKPAEEAVWRHFQPGAWETWHLSGLSCAPEPITANDPFAMTARPYPTATPTPTATPSRPPDGKVANVGDPTERLGGHNAELNRSNLEKAMKADPTTNSGTDHPIHEPIGPKN